MHRSNIRLLSLILFSLAWVSVHGASVIDLVREGQRCNNADSALSYYASAIRTYNSHPTAYSDSSYAEALYAASQLLFNHFEDFNNGFYFLRKAEKIAANSSDTHQLSKIESSLADLLSGIGNYNGAALNYQIALGIALKNRDWAQYLHSFIANALNSVYIDSDKTLESILRQYPEEQLPDSPASDFALLLRNGIDCINNNEEQQALDCFQAALSLAENNADLSKYRVVPIFLISKTKRLFHGVNVAEKSLLEYLPSLESNDKTLAYNYLSNIFRNIGEVDKADDYQLLYYKRLAINGFGVKFGDVWKAENLKRLLDANYQAPVPVNKDKDSDPAWIVCILLSAAVSVLLFICLRQRKQLKKTKRLLSESACSEETSDSTSSGDQQEEKENEEELKMIYESLSRAMEETDEKYSPDFTLNRLASIANVHPRKASRALNNFKGMTFNSWLADYRVREACRRLTDIDAYGNLTISAISEGLGFKSRTHFADVFKRVTGISPSEYQKQRAQES